MAAHQCRYPVPIESKLDRIQAGFSAPAGEDRVHIALKLRDKGWPVYKVRFDPESGAWVASVIDTKRAA
jgi:hypothetical protein